MTLQSRDWKAYDSITFMCYGKFHELLRCVICEGCSNTGMALLRCGHVVCNSSGGNAKKMCLEILEDEKSSTTTEDTGITYSCTTCSLDTTLAEILEMRSYMKHVLKLRKDLVKSWNDGNELWIYCEDYDCRKQHSEIEEPKPDDNETIIDLEVCRTCVPAQFFCAGSCSVDHAQDTGHRLEVYNPKEHEWWAACNITRYEIQEPARESNIAGTIQKLRVKPTAKQRPPSHLPDAMKHFRGVISESPPVTSPSAVAVISTEQYKNVKINFSCETEKHDAANATSASSDEMSQEDAVDTSAESDSSDELDPSVEEEFEKILNDINLEMVLLNSFDYRQYGTEKELPKLFSDLTATSKTSIIKTGFARRKEGKIHAEKVKSRVIYRNAAHLILLYTLIPRHHKNLAYWKFVFRRLSLQSLMEYCFPVWEFPVPNDGANSGRVGFVVPSFGLTSQQPFYQNLKGVLCEGVQACLDQHQGHVAEVTVAKFERNTGEWTEITRKNFAYQQTDSPHPHKQHWLKSIKIADNLYAVSTEEEISLVRIGINGDFSTYCISPATSRFGCGLWWNGSSLYATCVGTTHIAQWNFDIVKHSFIVHFRFRMICSKRPFSERDTVVVVQDEVCICYDITAPGSGVMSTEDRLQAFRLSNGNYIEQNFTLMFYMLPATVSSPSLLAVSTSLPNVIIRDDQTDSPALFVFSKVDDSWFKMDFSFSQLNPQPRAVVKDVWFHRGRLCLNLETTAQVAPADAQAAPADAQVAHADAQVAHADEEDAPADAQAAPADAQDAQGGAQVAHEDAQAAAADAQDAQGDAHDAQGDAQEAQGDAQDAQGDAQVAQGDAEVAQGDALVANADAQVAPSDAQVAPSDAQVAPSDAQDAPVDAQDALADAQTAPADAQTAPADAQTAPADAQAAPADAQVAPADAQAAPADAHDAPADAHDAQGDVQAAQGDAQVAQGDAQAAQGDAQAAQGDAQAAQGDAQAAQGDAQAAQGDAQAAQGDAQNVHAGGPDAPVDAQDAIADAQDAFADAQDAHARTHWIEVEIKLC